MAGRNISNLRYADDITLMAGSEGEIKSLLMKVKEESEKAGLKLNIQKMQIMASGPIISLQIVGETKETVRDFIFSGSKVTVDSHEIKKKKKCLLLGRTAMTKIDSILKSRDFTLLTKVCIVKAVVFPVVIYDVSVGPERRLSAKERMHSNCGAGEDSLRVPWTARRPNHSIQKEINPEYSLEGLMLKLKLQYSGHLI